MDRAALDGDRLRRGRPAELYAQAQTRKAELKDDVRGDPLVQAVLTRFPGAEIVDVAPRRARRSVPDDLPPDVAGDINRDDEP